MVGKRNRGRACWKRCPCECSGGIVDGRVDPGASIQDEIATDAVGRDTEAVPPLLNNPGNNVKITYCQS